MLSRRRLITGGAVAGAATLLPPALLNAAASNHVGSSQKKSVSDFLVVTTPSDTDFVSTLHKHFPGLLNDPIFQKIQSHSVLITNVSDKKIRAYCTHWKAITPTGGYETKIRHYFHPTSKKHGSATSGVKGNKNYHTGRVPAIKARGVRLVTPYFNWSPNHYRKHPNPQWQKTLTEKASRKFFLYELSNATGVQVTVDAVVINRCTVIGSDTTNLAKVFSVTRNAEHDEALAVHRLLVNGASLDQVATKLHAHATSSRSLLPPRTEPFHRLYNAVRRRQAQVLLRKLHHAGEEKFVKTVKYLKKQRRTTITRRPQA